jgi:glycosyltransferase involved in cell wall biosynthesis
MDRVAYLIGTFPALTETFVAREVQALRAAGVEVDLFSLRRPSAIDAQGDGADLMDRTCYGSSLSWSELMRANVRAARRSPLRYARALGAVLLHTGTNPVHCMKSLAVFPVAVAFAERMRERRATHVHAHWANYPATAAYIVSRVLGIPYSFTAHAHDASLIRAMLREKIRQAAFVMTCTGWTQNWLRRFAPEARDKIFLNYHGVVIDRFVPPRRPRAGRPSRFTLLSCGSLYPRKGFPYLLEACRQLRDRDVPVDCLIVGGGPMRAELQRFIDRHRLGAQVRLVGAVAPRDVVPFYREADLFVLACMTDYLGWRELLTARLLLLEVGFAIPFRPLTDGIPNVLVEAMAMEIPVISTPLAGIPELIQDGRTGCLVPEKDPVALADAITRLLDDPDRRAALGRAGRHAVLERFDRTRNIHQLVEVFTRAVPR